MSRKLGKIRRKNEKLAGVKKEPVQSNNPPRVTLTYFRRIRVSKVYFC